MQKLTIIFFLFIISQLSNFDLFAQTRNLQLYPGKRDNSLNEINRIEFEGNEAFSDADLAKLINLRSTNRSFVHSSMQYYYDQMKYNPATPKIILKAIDDNLQSMEDQISYFSSDLIEPDIESLWHFYNINGFHFPNISYMFFPDTINHINILSFIINEGPRFTLDTIVYLGLENLDEDTKLEIQNIKSLKGSRPFHEPSIINEINMVRNVLLNQGYFFAEFERPLVSLDTLNLTDSVTVVFNTGKRQRIGEIRIIDSLNGQRVVSRNMKQRQLNFETGDWYSRQKIRRSEQNLNHIGTFNSVNIDTTTSFGIINDTTLNIKVLLNYRRQNNWGVGLFFNRTTLNDFVNGGFEGSFANRNIFGAAQQIEFFANVSLNDFPRIFQKRGFQATEKIGRVGFKFNQPFLWDIRSWRIGLYSSPSYSASVIENLRLNTFSVPFKFTAELPKFTVFSNVSFDFTLESQNPVNFEEVKAKAEGEPGTSSIFAQSLFLYEDLYQFFQTKGNFALTANLFGITGLGDRRNNPFSPTRGYFIYTSAEVTNYAFAFMGQGLAKYFRINGQLSYFYSSNNLSVYAFKFRGGAIGLFEKNNNYVPIDRQFFAGGANSVRGWQTRQLHYSDKKPGDDLTKTEYEFLSNVLGSGVIIEGSFEFRYAFERYKNMSDFVAEQIANMGVTFFLDFGNAFHWFAEDEQTKTHVKPLDYITKLAWGAGMGFRYETPIGPIRLDFALPIYGPVFDKSDFIYNRKNVLGDLQFYIGIGHAF